MSDGGAAARTAGALAAGAAGPHEAAAPAGGDLSSTIGTGPPAPVAEQARAIGDRERDLFLAAGAGTGKTTVLVERFCEAVCTTEGGDADLGVERVLAFTFTERAAAELKRRIRTELARRADMASDLEQARRLRSLARDSESAWISTIHSFCQRVLASHPIAAGLDPGFRVLDAPAAARIAAEAFDAAFERFGAGGDDDRVEMAAAYRLPALRTVVRTAHDELRSRGVERPELPPLASPDVEGAAAGLRAAASAALAATEGGKASGKFHECRSLIAAALAGTEDGVPDEEEEVASWGFESKAKGLAVPEVERYHEARAKLERRLVELRFAGHYEHLRALVALYAEEYASRKEERSALDFEDLQLRARRLLEEHPEVGRRYRRQFRHVMVDEFQDTNALQAAIVRLVHEDGGAACNRLFTVGDELQSIYGFRHADVDVFRAERRAADAAPDDRAGVRRLAGNFRSRPEVLALVNTIGRALFGPGYESLAVGAPPGDAGSAQPAVEVLATERKGWDDEDAPAIEVSPDERAQAWRVAEARFLAERLRSLHDSGESRGGMVVLLRSYSYVEAYEEALEQVGLAPHVVGGRGYWSKQQVADVRSLLGCVANPLDDRALLGALASPACGVRPDTLWLLRRAAGGSAVWWALRRAFGGRNGVRDTGGEAEAEGGRHADGDSEADGARAERRARAEEAVSHVPADDADALREFTAVLDGLRAEAPRLSLEALIDRVITATGYDLALLMRRPRGRRRMANVRKLMRLAREFEADEGRELRAFLDFVASETELGGREAEAAVDAEGHDGVRLMTTHAAKGLEFPVVAVADLGRKLSAGAPPALRLEPGGQAALDGPSAAEPDGGGGIGPGGGEAEADAPVRHAGAMRVGMKLARLGRKQVRIFDYEELEERAVERERQEERRILHVAMTRAQRRLILSGAFELERIEDEPKPTDPLIAPVLRALRWAPGRDVVELDPPPLAPGATGQLGPARVAMLTRSPGDVAPSVAALGAPVDADGGRAGDWRRERAGYGERDGPGNGGRGDRPLQDPDLSPPVVARGAPLRALSYSALSLHERCGYRFYAERVLGMRPRLPRPAGTGSVGAAGRGTHRGPATASATAGVEAANERSSSSSGDFDSHGSRIDEWHPDEDIDALASRYARGRVVHRLLEHSARQGWAAPDRDHVAELLRGEGVDPVLEQVRRTTLLVEAFLAAPMMSDLAGASRLHVEVPFAFRVADLVVRGEIDLLADLGSELLVIDYKSDALGDASPADHMGRYEVQRLIYALAALRRYGKPVRVAYVFLELPDQPVEARFSYDDASWIGDRLATMAGAISAGRFEVTSTPERSLCFDCPARERLCVHGPELTLRHSAG